MILTVPGPGGPGQMKGVSAMSKTRSIAVAALCAASLAACSGGGADVKTTTTTVSVGQQLLDLQAAQKTGAISPQEYERLKTQLINRVTGN
jgi:hypothetical protein